MYLGPRYRQEIRVYIRIPLLIFAQVFLQCRYHIIFAGNPFNLRRPVGGTGEEHYVLVVGWYCVEHRAFALNVKVCRHDGAGTTGLRAVFDGVDGLQTGLIEDILSP